MLNLPGSVRIFLCLSPADMRRSFDGLARMTEEVIAEDPFSGHLFVFRNRRRDRIKILFWDRDGFSLYYKRLEAGVFHFPTATEPSVRISAAQLMLILEGVEVAGLRRQKRYVRHEYLS